MTESQCQHKLYISKEDEEANKKRFKLFNYEFQEEDGSNQIRVGDTVNFRLRNSCAGCDEKIYVLHRIKKS